MDFFGKISKDLGIGIGKGAAIGFTALAIFTFVGLPVSYVANRFIYHSKGMRGLLCLVTAVLSIPIFLCMAIYQTITAGNGLAKIHYFGYLPFIYKGAPDSVTKSDDYGVDWIMSFFWRAVYWIRDTLLSGFVDHRETDQDQAAFKEACRFGLVPESDKGDPAIVILEKAVELAQQAAKAVDIACFKEIEQLQINLLKGPKGMEPGEISAGCQIGKKQTPPVAQPAPRELEMTDLPLKQAGASV